MDLSFLIYEIELVVRCGSKHLQSWLLQKRDNLGQEFKTNLGNMVRLWQHSPKNNTNKQKVKCGGQTHPSRVIGRLEQNDGNKHMRNYVLSMYARLCISASHFNSFNHHRKQVLL